MKKNILIGIVVVFALALVAVVAMAGPDTVVAQAMAQDTAITLFLI
ncbi:MAG TPA: hypothetical protein PKZ54_07835 [Syntrophorhabdaceae bacterium]|nr:hypothetical protein [Syntrophorhabdaceae bacterium]